MTATLTIALVACGKSKLEHAAPARELYTGNLFRAAAGHAEATADRWYVLSAAHGLVHPDAELEPYDATLTDATRDELASWARAVFDTLRMSNAALTRGSFANLPGEAEADKGMGRLLMEGATVEVVVYAGVAYRAELVRLLEGLEGVTVTVPLEGKGIGEQLGWYAAARRAREAVVVELDDTAADFVEAVGWAVVAMETDDSYDSFVEPVTDELADLPDELRDAAVEAAAARFSRRRPADARWIARELRRILADVRAREAADAAELAEAEAVVDVFDGPNDVPDPAVLTPAPSGPHEHRCVTCGSYFECPDPAVDVYGDPCDTTACEPCRWDSLIPGLAG